MFQNKHIHFNAASPPIAHCQVRRIKLKKLLNLIGLLFAILLLFCACSRPDIDIPYGFTRECHVKLEHELRQWVNEDLEGDVQNVRIYVYAIDDVKLNEPKIPDLVVVPEDKQPAENYALLIEIYKSNIEKAKAEQDQETFDRLTRELSTFMQDYEANICAPIRARYQSTLDWLDDHKAPWEFDIENIDFSNYKDVYISATVTKQNLIDLYLFSGIYFYKVELDS